MRMPFLKNVTSYLEYVDFPYLAPFLLIHEMSVHQRKLCFDDLFRLMMAVVEEAMQMTPVGKVMT